MHCGPGIPIGVTTGDRWDTQWVPSLLSSEVYSRLGKHFTFKGASSGLFEMLDKRANSYFGS